MPDKRTAAALLVTGDGRYLIRQRDDLPWIDFAGHWCLFGGVVEPGERCVDALRRELDEEIGFAPGPVREFTRFCLVIPSPTPRLTEINFFTVPITRAQVPRLVLKEGQNLSLQSAAQIAAIEKIIPWDLAAILMHARRVTLFPPKQLPHGEDAQSGITRQPSENPA